MLGVNFPGSGNSDKPRVSCFLETPDHSGCTHCVLFLSGRFHLTYPTPSWEAFLGWFSNSWNLLPATRRVSWDHTAQQSVARSRLQPPGLVPGPSEGLSSAARSPRAASLLVHSPQQSLSLAGPSRPLLQKRVSQRSRLTVASTLTKIQFPWCFFSAKVRFPTGGKENLDWGRWSESTASIYPAINLTLTCVERLDL